MSEHRSEDLIDEPMAAEADSPEVDFADSASEASSGGGGTPEVPDEASSPLEEPGLGDTHGDSMPPRLDGA